MGYIVYNSTTFIIDSLHFTQAEANTRANTSTELTAKVGAVTIPRNIQPGRSYYNATDSIILPDAPPVTLSELDITKLRLKGIHEAYYKVLYPAILEESLGHPDNSRSLLLDIVLGAVKGVYIVANDTSKSNAYKVNYASSIIMGPSEIITPGQPENMSLFFEAIESATIPQNFIRGNPISWSTTSDMGATFTRKTLQNAVNSVGTDFPTVPSFSMVQLVNPSWIDDIT